MLSTFMMRTETLPSSRPLMKVYTFLNLRRSIPRRWREPTVDKATWSLLLKRTRRVTLSDNVSEQRKHAPCTILWVAQTSRIWSTFSGNELLQTVPLQSRTWILQPTSMVLMLEHWRARVPDPSQHLTRKTTLKYLLRFWRSILICACASISCTWIDSQCLQQSTTASKLVIVLNSKERRAGATTPLAKLLTQCCDTTMPLDFRLHPSTATKNSNHSGTIWKTPLTLMSTSAPVETNNRKLKGTIELLANDAAPCSTVCHTRKSPRLWSSKWVSWLLNNWIISPWREECHHTTVPIWYWTDSISITRSTANATLALMCKLLRNPKMPTILKHPAPSTPFTYVLYPDLPTDTELWISPQVYQLPAPG